MLLGNVNKCDTYMAYDYASVADKLDTCCVDTINSLTTIDDRYILLNKEDEIKKLKMEISDLKNKNKMHTFTIKNVKIPNPNKVVIVEFSDGTKERAICHEEDQFCLETGITICLAKKMMGGHKEYNKYIKSIIKMYNDNIKKKNAEQEEKERKERKRQHEIDRKKRRRERKIAEQIKIQKEAYLMAMKEISAK